MRGLKVVSSKEMKRIEKEAILKGAKEESFFKKASFGIFSFLKDYKKAKKIILFLGKGNNAKDALLAGILLLKEHFSVKAYLVFEKKEFSKSLKELLQSFKNEGGKIVDTVSFQKEEIIVDGIFGIGFKGKISEKISGIIKKINDSPCLKISIDIPSALGSKVCICADVTIFMQLPKTEFFLNKGWDSVGDLKKVDFGLKEEFVKKAKEDFFLLDEKNIPKILPKMKRSQNKYEAGYVIGIAGSSSMEGAAEMSAISCLRSGSGIVKLFSTSFSEYYPEIIRKKLIFKGEEILDSINKAGSVFIGPGLGREEKIFHFLQKIIPKIKVPCVLDADALYFFSKHSFKLPKNAVMTPHRKEMLRLLGKKELKDEDLIKKTQEFVDRHQVILVLKGGPSFIFSPYKKPILCIKGSKGMATAGTGDILTGIIASFLTKTDAFKATILGVYIHGYTGWLLEKKKTAYPIIAQDVIDYLPESFKRICSGFGTNE